MPGRAKVGDVKDDLNRTTVEVLMTAQGIDSYSDLSRRMERVSGRKLDRSYVSRVMRGDRPAQPSFIVACAGALKVPTIAITGQGVDISIEDELEASA